MLTSYLNKSPPSKFILIEDSIDVRGDDLLQYVVNTHILSGKRKIHFFVSERNVEYYKCLFIDSKIVFHENLISPNDIEKALEGIQEDAIVIFNSLTYLMYELESSNLARILNALKTKSNIAQIIGVIHMDVVEKSDDVCNCFEYLSTLSLRLMLLGKESKPTILFTYRKPSGKVIRQYEEFSIKNGTLISEPIKKIDPKRIIEDAIVEVSPQDLTTFKIGLDDREKEERDKLVLPFLPKEETQSEGSILYQLEEGDDWDPEDPDDDLDF